MKRLWTFGFVVALLLAGALVAACGDDDDNGNGGDGVTTPANGGAQTPAAGGDDGDGTVLEIVAENSEEFSTDELSAPAGTITVRLDNREDGVAHNWSLYPSEDEITEQIAATEIIIGPDTAEVTFEVEAGEYFFRCDPHPNMTGTLTVE